MNPGIWFGVISVGKINIQHNHFFSGFFESRGDAMTAGRNLARETHDESEWNEVNAVAYRIDNDTIIEAANRLN